MLAQDRHTRLIDSLAAGLAPVARLASPARRIAGWLLLVGLPAAGLAAVANLHGVLARYAAEPALVLAAAGSTATAAAAAAAAVLMTLPDRSARWALLPVPSLAFWIGAGVAGAASGTGYGAPIPLSAACSCFAFIVGLGVPFALLLVASLKQGYALRPGLTAGLAGLAASSAAASILGLFHPFEMALDDLGMHALAVALLSGLFASFGSRLMHRRSGTATDTGWRRGDPIA
ncbi:UNVERIFIED_CONTAM: NrsF family protein [Methylobacteriaceae bacterium AG10]|nr:NrsF family protein [Methylobacteriaceae bacterium AG10]